MCTNVYLFLTATIGTAVIAENLECGKQVASSESDSATHPNEFPWLVLLQRNDEEHNYCEGALISSRYVLTAAHCVSRKLPTSIILGEYDTNAIDCIVESELCKIPLSVTYDKIIKHPKFTLGNTSDNIALIKLASDVPFIDHIRPICLPSPLEQIHVGEQLDLAGWKKSITIEESSVKIKAKITIFDDSKCSKYETRVELGNKHICAGASNESSTGPELSGSPLMKFNKDTEKWYAEGILAFGTVQYGTESHPDLYMKVSEYVDWIKSEIKK